MKRKCSVIHCDYFVARGDFRLIDCEIEKIRWCNNCNEEASIDDISTADYPRVINKFRGSNSRFEFYG
jgi:hypothetical protein